MIRTNPKTWSELRPILQDLDKLAILEMRNIFNQNWVFIPTEAYYPAAPDTHTILTKMSLSPFLLAGLPIRYICEVAGVDVPFYGILDSFTTTTLSVIGAPISGTIKSLHIGYASGALHLSYHVPGDYGDGIADLLQADLSRFERWDLSPVRLAGFAARHTVNATVTNPFINVRIDGDLVSTENGGDGIQPTAAAWVANGAVEIDPAEYLLSRHSEIEIACTVADVPGAGVHASNLSIILWLVSEDRDLARIFSTLE